MCDCALKEVRSHVVAVVGSWYEDDFSDAGARFRLVVLGTDQVVDTV